MDMKLAVVLVPVSDVDRVQVAGFRLDADFISEDFRIVQLTPPGSECSMMVAADIDAGRAELVGRGADVRSPSTPRTGCSTTPPEGRAPGAGPRARRRFLVCRVQRPGRQRFAAARK
jgi:hypothetical protein